MSCYTKKTLIYLRPARLTGSRVACWFCYMYIAIPYYVVYALKRKWYSNSVLREQDERFTKEKRFILRDPEKENGFRWDSNQRSMSNTR